METLFKIQKNFLDEDQYNQMKKIITSVDFSWYLQHGVAFSGNNDVYFTHTFFVDDKINSNLYSTIVEPIVDKLKIKKLLRARLTLITNTKKRMIHGFHKDRLDKHTVALFYFNTNNGCTLFKDTKVKPEDNKIVIFDGSLEHSSTTCTDKNYRITLNINYEF